MKHVVSSSVIFSLLLGLFSIGLSVGSFDTSIVTIFSSIFSYNELDASQFVILELRMPRLFAAFLVGILLAISGYLMQALVNNPLADPYLLGTSSGASLGASISFLGFFPVHILATSFFSFTGALVVTIVAVLLSYSNGRINPTRLLLAGVGLSSLMVSITSLLMYQSGEESRVRSIVFWTLGGFETVKWSQLPMLGLSALVLITFFLLLHKKIAILLLGEERAVNLGMNVGLLRKLILVACAVATGFSVAVAGPIGFVGLIIPHFTRAVYGISNPYTILYTGLWGGVFLLACDVLARLIFYPAGVPIGIITSFVGIPFFIFLLTKTKLPV